MMQNFKLNNISFLCGVLYPARATSLS